MRITKSILNRMILTITIPAGVLFFSGNAIVSAQEEPPVPLVITPTAQGLGFGAFTYAVTSGTVTITPASGRSSTGDLILLNLGYSFSAALYEVVGNNGAVVSILNGADATLNRSGGGGTMTLHIGDSNPTSPFVLTVPYPTPTMLYIGGTLTVGSSATNPPGDYSGTFDITYVQE